MYTGDSLVPEERRSQQSSEVDDDCAASRRHTHSPLPAHVPVLSDVHRPELPMFVRSSMYSLGSRVRQFVDTDLSDASAPFISYQPFASAVRRPIFQAGLLLVALKCALLTCCLLATGLDRQLGTRKMFTSDVGRYQHAAVQCIVVLLILRSVHLGRAGYGAVATKVFGMCPILVGISFAMLSGIAFQADDVELAIFWLCWIVATGLVAYAALVNEGFWLLSFFGMACFSIPATLVLFHDRQPPLAFGFLACGFVFFGIAISAKVMLRKELRKAVRETQVDKEKYDLAWQEVLETQENSLMQLATHVLGRERNDKILQPSNNLNHLYQLAYCVHHWYEDIVKGWAASLGLQAVPTPVKNVQRALEKVQRSYNGEVRQVIDIVRASIVATTIEEVHDALRFVERNADVGRVKNRFDPEYDGQETFGYRDLNVNLTFPEQFGTTFEGFVFELQIHLKVMMQQKHNAGHSRYIQVRNSLGK